LLTGGLANGEPSNAAALYDPSTATTSATAAGMTTARASHSATVLPDGRVLVFGGIGARGELLGNAEVFDPQTQSFVDLSNTGLAPRAHHVANLLTDGTVLFAGGESLVSAQLWNPDSTTASTPNGEMLLSRIDPTSALLATGPVLISGGADRKDVARPDELYIPSGKVFESAETVSALIPSLDNLEIPGQVAETVPTEGASNIPGSSRIAVRFTQPMSVGTLNASTVTLVGPAGSVGINVVAAEGGMLLFVSPVKELLPGEYYTLFVRGALDAHQRALAPLTLGFSTAKLAASSSSPRTTVPIPGLWQPPRLGQPWVMNKAPTVSAGSDGTSAAKSVAATPAGAANKALALGKAAPTANSPEARNLSPPARQKPSSTAVQSAQATSGVTALAGQVLLQNGQPLPGVTVSAAHQASRTDATGHFILTNLPAGHMPFVVDGRTANTKSVEYGQFVIGADLIAGKTTTLDYTIWMPVIDTAHAVSLSAPTTKEVEVTSPLLPGVVLKIPAGAVIREPNGRIATSVSLTPVPLDRSPFPTPQFSMYFVIQPGGAVIESASGSERLGARLIYPNPMKRPVAFPSYFMYYDPSGAGWTNYGRGHVADSGDRIDPDQDTRLYSFSGFGDIEAGNPPAPEPVPPGGCSTSGDPVDCATGLFLYRHVDLFVKDTIPIVITRSYQSSDTYPRNFGVGFTFDYGMWLYSTAGPTDTSFQTLYLILPDGSQVPFTRTVQSSQTGLAGLQMIASGTPSQYIGATVTYDGTAYLVMTTKDGTQYRFNAADGRFLRSITNRNGQVLQVVAGITQTGENYPIVTLNSPSGRWVQIQYVGSVGSYPTGTSMISSVMDDSGRTVSYSYDTSNRLIKVTYPDGGFEQFTYDGTSGRIASVILPNGQTKVANLYDANHRVSQQTLADGGIYKFSYVTNGSGQVTQTTVTDPNNNVRVTQLNAAGYVTSDTFASGTSIQQVVTYQRDPITNLLTSRTDALNRTTSYTYDSMGNVKTTTLLSGTPNAATITYTYTAPFNEVATVTDPLNHTTTYAYDSYGNLTTITDPLNHVVAAITYNTALALPTQVTDALNHVLRFSYQGSDLTSITDALGRTRTRSVDALGRTVAATDALGETVLLSWNFRDEITQLTDPLGNVTAFVYDLDGNLTKITDARGGVTQYAYDGKDRVKQHIDQLNHSETYAYDGNDNVTNRTDRKGQQQVLTFDALNRLSQIQYKTNSGGVESTVNYSFDAGDRLTQIADSASGTITRTYDGLDHLTNETTPYGSTGYQYDAAGRRGQLTVSGQSAPITYGYDADDHLVSVTQGSNQTTITYDNAMRRSTVTLPNGVLLTYGYDNANELTGLTYSAGSTTVGTLTYSYDAAGRISNRGGTLDATNLPAAVSTTGLNAANQLTNWAGATLTYDNNGNLTSAGGNTYTWNTRNELVAISGTTTASFVYDAFGRRQSRTVGSTSTNFLYDRANLIQELAGTTATVNYLTGARIDETFARTDTTSSQSFLWDALHSTVALTNSSGSIATSYTYEPYGATTSTGTTSTNTLQYTGRESDATGLYYYRGRYYSPGFGRFISEDPLGSFAGPNAYAYALANPISWADPYGFLSCETRGLDDSDKQNFHDVTPLYSIGLPVPGPIPGQNGGHIKPGVGLKLPTPQLPTGGLEPEIGAEFEWWVQVLTYVEYKDGIRTHVWFEGIVTCTWEDPCTHEPKSETHYAPRNDRVTETVTKTGHLWRDDGIHPSGYTSEFTWALEAME
jgi:RHS repeat-associated protein